MHPIAEHQHRQPLSRPQTAISIRVTLQEKSRIVAMAEQRGITVSEFLRTMAGCHPQQNTVRRIPTLEEKQLARLIAQVSILGQGLKQLQADDRPAISPLLLQVRHVLDVLIEVVL